MKELLEIQLEFNKQLITGISYHFLNNPIISWENGFLQGLTAFCALIALFKIFSQANNTTVFASEMLSFGFYLALVFANFGVINPRDFFSLGLKGNYDYMNKDTPPSSKELNIAYVATTPTLDREIYNAISMFANDMAAMIRGTGEITQSQMQTSALQNTIYFLNQVTLSKYKCVGFEKGTPQEYANCVGAFVPSMIPIAPGGERNELVCKDPNTGAKILCKDGTEEVVAAGGTAATSTSGGILDFVTPDYLERVARLATAAYMWCVLAFSDPLFTIFLPALLALIEIVRSAVSFVMLIGFGFAAAGTMFFAKFISPLILLPKFRGQVISAYKTVFQTTLYGFVAELFVFFSTILTLGLRDACYNTIIPYLLKGQGTDGMEFAMASATITVMVYIAVCSVLVIQVYSLTKIPDGCKALMNLQVTTFVSMGEELAGVGAKLGMAVGAVAVALPALVAGAAVMATAGPALAGVGGAVGGLAAGTGKIGAVAMKAKGVGKMAMKGAQVAQNVAKKGGAMVSKYGGGATDFVFGKDAGDNVRKAVGGESYGGGGKDTSTLPAKGGGGAGEDAAVKKAKAESKGEAPTEGDKKDSKDSASTTSTAGFKAKDTPTSSSKSGGGGDSSMPDFKGSKSKSSTNSDGTEKKEDRRPGWKKMLDKSMVFKGSKMIFDAVNNNAGKMGLDSTLRSNGKSFKDTAVGTIGKGVKGMADGAREKLENFGQDEESQAKFQKFRNFVGAESDEDRAIALSNLQQTMDDRGQNQDMDLESAAKFKELSSKVDTKEGASEEEMAELFKMSRTRNFAAGDEAESLKKLEENKSFSDYSKKKDFEFQAARDQYLANGNKATASRLNSLMSQGAGSMANTMSAEEYKNQAANLAENGTLPKEVQERFDKQAKLNEFREKTQQRVTESVDRSLSPAVEAMKQLKEDENLSEEKKKEYNARIAKTVSNFTNSNSLSAAGLGNKNFGELAAHSGALSQEEAESYQNAGSRQKVVGEMETALKDLQSDLELSNGSSVKNVEDKGLMAFDVNNNQVDKIKLSEIKNTQEREKMETILSNIEIILGRHSSNAFKKADGSSIYSNEQIAKMTKIRDMFEK